MTFFARISRGIAYMVTSALTFAQASTAVTSWGVSFAMLAGGASIVGVIVIGGVTYHVYIRRNSKPPQIEQVVLQYPIDLQKIKINLVWEPIKMTLEEYNDLEVFTMEEFNQEMSEFICHAGTRQIMRKPCLMRCCKNSQREHKWAEKNLLKLVIRKRGRCLLCQSQADESFIQFNRSKAAAILGYRHMLVKVYRQATAQDKPIWKQLIDSKFGLGYTDEHLENFQFAEPVANQVSRDILIGSHISTDIRSEISDQSDVQVF